MRKSQHRFFLYTLIIGLLVAGLLACSSSEDKAQASFAQASAAEQSGKLAEAEAQYRQLLSEFPETPAAQQAREQLAGLERLRQIQQQTERQAASAAVKSIRRVVESYHSVYHQWPKSIKDFDDGKYLFDSDYMAESVSEGFNVYLALGGEGAGYRLWNFPVAAEYGFLQNGEGKTPVEVKRGEALAEIEAEYLVEAKKGTVTFLQPRI